MPTLHTRDKIISKASATPACRAQRPTGDREIYNSHTSTANGRLHPRPVTHGGAWGSEACGWGRVGSLRRRDSQEGGVPHPGERKARWAPFLHSGQGSSPAQALAEPSHAVSDAWAVGEARLTETSGNPERALAAGPPRPGEPETPAEAGKERPKCLRLQTMTVRGAAASSRKTELQETFLVHKNVEIHVVFS